MNKYNKTISIVIFFFTIILKGEIFGQRKCTGSLNCSACTNCSACRYCNSGGTCGVCGKRTKNNSSVDNHTHFSDAFYTQEQTLHKIYFAKTLKKVNLRAGTSIESEILTIIPMDKIITVTSDLFSGWSQVEYMSVVNNKIIIHKGYILTDFLKKM
jgi:hypothetical protein